MGTFSRFRHVVSANVNALLERAEDPEKMLKALVREMEDALDEAREAAGSLSAERKQMDRRIAALGDEQKEWAQRAEKALQQGEEDMARQALSRKMTLADEQQGARNALEQAVASVSRIEGDIARLEERLNEARERQKQFQKSSPVRPIPVKYNSPAERRLAGVMIRFDELESRMEHLESRVESYDIGRGAPPSWAPQVDQEVEEEFQALKARVQAPSVDGDAGEDTSNQQAS
jgi:phage shock protein A